MKYETSLLLLSGLCSVLFGVILITNLIRGLFSLSMLLWLAICAFSIFMFIRTYKQIKADKK